MNSAKSLWETCMTICRQWSWKPGDMMKTRPECLQTLIRAAGGELLTGTRGSPNEVSADGIFCLQA